jgi:hypothetical protein
MTVVYTHARCKRAGVTSCGCCESYFESKAIMRK